MPTRRHRLLVALVAVAAVAVSTGAGGRQAAPASASRTSPTPRQEHVVRKGENLTTIARRYGVTVSALAAENRVTNVHHVVAGRRLVIPKKGASATTKTSAGTMQLASSSKPARSGTVTPGRLPQRLRERPERLALAPRFDHWAKTYSVPPDLLKAMAWHESGWQAHRVSSTGAVGVGQLMPDTVIFVSEQLLRTKRLNPRDPDQNIRMSARFLRYLIDQTGSERKAAAAYYQGLGSVTRRGLYAETTAYVDDVMALRPAFR